jgi:type II secretory ATPase GspE/PulE/Tfp pilus assembly ATPase PilB-like protein
MNLPAHTRQPASGPSDTIVDLLHSLERTRRMPVTTLAEALRELGFLDGQTLASLATQDARLLGVHCGELVARGLITREQLGRALAHMTGLPNVSHVDIERAPREFLSMLLERRPLQPLERPAPARDMATLLEAMESLRHTPIMTLRQALEDLRLIDPATMDRLTAEDPEIFRAHRILLVRQALLSRDELGRALAFAAGLPEVDAEHFSIAPDAFRVLPAKMARAYEALPLGPHEDFYFVACGSPTSDELRANISATIGGTVVLVWADSNAIRERIDRTESAHFDETMRPEMLEWTQDMPAQQRIAPEDKAAAKVQELISQAEMEVDAVLDREPAAAVGDRSGMARLVKHMVMDARASGASDIHIESNLHDTGTLVRMRIDGDLRPYLTVPAKLRSALVSRIKVMARLDIAERRRPQDGKIDFSDFGGEKLELRVAVLPTHDGMENVVLRLLATAEPMPLASLGLQPRDAETIARLSARTFGLILAVGPTGSGKTTTLHSMLMGINTEERKIWTAEDPIEITQPGLNQVQVNAKIGVTFAAAMRSFLRADPDVIMIGEIRDAETAKIAIEASLTGHLVLSTLHTNSACESVVRLLDLGLDPLNFSDSLLGIVAQRLVRGLCRHCAVPEALDAAAYDALLAEYIGPTRLTRELAQQRLLAAAGVTAPEDLRLYKAHGCPECGGKGTKGRVGVYEILENSPELRELVQTRARPSEIFEVAVAGGMRSLRHDALEKAVQGRLDLAQARMAFT